MELCLVEHDKDNFNRNRVDPCSTQRKLHIHLKCLSFSVCLHLFPKRFVDGFINLVEEWERSFKSFDLTILCCFKPFKTFVHTR